MQYILKRSDREGEKEFWVFHGEDGKPVMNPDPEFRDWMSVRVGEALGKFYGGCGEGEEYDTFEEAMHRELYDEYQVSDVLKEKDFFVVKADDGKDYQFKAVGVHIVKAGVYKND